VLRRILCLCSLRMGLRIYLTGQGLLLEMVCRVIGLSVCLCCRLLCRDSWRNCRMGVCRLRVGLVSCNSGIVRWRSLKCKICILDLLVRIINHLEMKQEFEIPITNCQWVRVPDHHFPKTLEYHGHGDTPWEPTIWKCGIQYNRPLIWGRSKPSRRTG